MPIPASLFQKSSSGGTTNKKRRPQPSFFVCGAVGTCLPAASPRRCALRAAFGFQAPAGTEYGFSDILYLWD